MDKLYSTRPTCNRPMLICYAGIDRVFYCRLDPNHSKPCEARLDERAVARFSQRSLNNRTMSDAAYERFDPERKFGFPKTIDFVPRGAVSSTQLTEMK